MSFFSPTRFRRGDLIIIVHIVQTTHAFVSASATGLIFEGQQRAHLFFQIGSTGTNHSPYLESRFRTEEASARSIGPRKSACTQTSSGRELTKALLRVVLSPP